MCFLTKIVGLYTRLKLQLLTTILRTEIWEKIQDFCNANGFRTISFKALLSFIKAILVEKNGSVKVRREKESGS